MFIEVKSTKHTLEEIISLLNWEDTVRPSEPIKQATSRAQSLLVDIETGEADMEGFINEMAAAFDETMADVPF